MTDDGHMRPEEGAAEGRNETGPPIAERIRPIASVAVLVALAAFGLVFMARLHDFDFNPGDEGVAAMSAWRIAQGQVPHRDFYEIVPPFSFLPTALAFKLFGPGLGVLRALVLLYAVLLILCAERLLAGYTKSLPARALVVSFLIPMGVLYWPMPSHHWVVDIVQMGALLALLRGLGSSRAWLWGALSGIATALGCFSMQDQGAYLVLALGVLFFPWVRDGRRRAHLLAGWAAGGIAVGAAFALYLLPHVSLRELWDQWVVFPASRYGGIAGNKGGLLRGLAVLGTEKWRSMVAEYPSYALSWAVLSCFITALPLLAAVTLGAGWKRKWTDGARLGLLAAGTVAFLGGCMHRYTLQNMIWAAPLPLVVFAWLLARGIASTSRWRRGSALALCLLVTAAGLTYAQSLYRLAHPDRTTEIRARAGARRFYRQPRAGGMQAVLDAVQEHVPEGDPLFCTRFNPFVNFWTRSPNPTRHNFLIYPGYHREGHLREIVSSLEAHPRTSVFLFLPFETDNELGAFLQANHRTVWKAPLGMLMVPRDPVPPTHDEQPIR